MSRKIGQNKFIALGLALALCTPPAAFGAQTGSPDAGPDSAAARAAQGESDGALDLQAESPLLPGSVGLISSLLPAEDPDAYGFRSYLVQNGFDVRLVDLIARYGGLYLPDLNQGKSTGESLHPVYFAVEYTDQTVAELASAGAALKAEYNLAAQNGQYVALSDTSDAQGLAQAPDPGALSGEGFSQGGSADAASGSDAGDAGQIAGLIEEDNSLTQSADFIHAESGSPLTGSAQTSKESGQLTRSEQDVVDDSSAVSPDSAGSSVASQDRQGSQTVTVYTLNSQKAEVSIRIWAAAQSFEK